MNDTSIETAIIYLPGKNEDPVQSLFQAELRALRDFLKGRGLSITRGYSSFGKKNLSQFPDSMVFNGLFVAGDGLPAATAKLIRAFYNGWPGRSVILAKSHRGLWIEANTSEKLSILCRSLEGVRICNPPSL